MTDEIEIEEHDLLDDPTVRNIFPDIARLKKEILDYEYNEEHQEPTSSTSNSQINRNKDVGNDINDSVSESKTNFKLSGNLQDTSQNNNQHNGFIRGDKGIEVQVHNNKIILGTKPAGPLETNSVHFEKHVKPYCAVVVAEDFGLYLNNSSRYCSQCLIFFPTNSDYNDHKIKFHTESINDTANVQEENASIIHKQEIQKRRVVVAHRNQNTMVQMNTNKTMVRLGSKNFNKCLKCKKVFTRKTYLRTHMMKVHKITRNKLDEIIPDRRISEANECFHCKKLFRSQTLLIEHIYSILQTPNNVSDKFANKMVIGNKTNKDFTSNKINMAGNEMKNLAVNDKIKVIQENKNITQKNRNVSDEVQNVLKVFRCNFCSFYFKTIRYFGRHMTIKHKTVKNFQTAKVIFDPKCKYCPKKSDSVVKYNSHIKKCHRHVLIGADKESRKSLLNANKGTGVASKNSPQNYFRCDHCFLYFSNIPYYYRHMAIKHKSTVSSIPKAKTFKFDPKCPFCPKMCNNLRSFNIHLFLHHSDKFNNIVRISKKVPVTTSETRSTTVSDDDADTEYQTCNFCSLYFKFTKNLIRHMTIKHKTVNIPKWKKVKFIPKCKFCPKVFDNKTVYNKHILKCHSDKINQVIKILTKPKENNSHKGESSNNIKSSTVSDDDTDTEYQTCNFCSLYFKTTKNFIRHMTIKHKTVKIPKSKKVKFIPKCKFCPKVFDDINLYNNHISKCHSQRSNQFKILTKPKESSNDIKNQKGIECFKCCFCPSYFMTMTYYVKHVKFIHKIAKIPKPKYEKFDSKCKYCPAILNDMKSYNKHFYNNHYAELNQVIAKTTKAYQLRTTDRNKILADDGKVNLAKTLYRCCYCSYYFKTLKIYSRHVMKKHKVQDVHEVKKIVFDPKCKYCSTVASDEIAYNKHLSGNHWNRINDIFKESSKKTASAKSHGLSKEVDNDTLSPAVQKAPESKKLSQSGSKSINLEKKISKNSNQVVSISKSALFKCHKCDIHFLTIKSALDHSNHMEMLINWKCALCHRIFKDNDRWLHEKQHLFSHVFTVYDIEQSNLSQILYKCSKCFMHFDESVVENHHYECVLKVPKSYMCQICNFLVDTKAQICHEYNHKHRHFTSNDFILIETTAVREETNKNKHNLKEKNNTKNKKKLDNTSTKFTKNQDQGESNCKYPKKILKRKIMNNESIECLQNKKIKKNEDADSIKSKLQSDSDKMKFSSEVSINQQNHDKFSLKLSFCNTCKSFVSMVGQKRKTHAQKRCAHLKTIACKDCGLKLTYNALSTHRRIHLKIKNLQLMHFKFYDFKSGKRVLPPMPEYETCGICFVNFISKSTLGRHICSDSEYKVCDICKIKLYKPVFHLHMAFHKYRIDEPSAGASSDNTIAINKTVEVRKTSRHVLLLLYCCKVCYIYVDTYDRLIEHCQKHCLNNLSPHNEECKICNLPFEEDCLKRHTKIHELVGGSSFEKLFFDPFYYRFDHTVWLKHVFESHSHVNKDEILLNSIYRHEHRFKMEMAQEGSLDLTLYKCVKCNCHVEADIIYQHVKNSCSNLRKYLCPICKLDFISSFSLQRHKTVHTDSKPIRYRIIHFNKKEDAELNKVIFSSPKLYVLYQCRHCNVVVGSTQRTSHKCNKKAFTSCGECGLFINEDIYELHSSMHKTLDSFISENIKVILFGQYQSHNEKYTAMESSFRGKILDYSFYKCSKCNVCVTRKSMTLNHTCCWKGQARVACSICGLYFYADKLISHVQNHETDPDFVLDNMVFIEFHPSIPKDAELLNKTSIELDSNNKLENAKQNAVIMEDVKETAFCSEEANNTTVCSESRKDTAVYSGNVKDSSVSRENVKGTAISLVNMKEAAVRIEEAENTTVNLENAKDPLVSLQSAENTAVNLENEKDAIVRKDKTESTTDSLENAEGTGVRLQNAKDSPVGQESAKVSLENVKDAVVRKEEAENTTVNLKNVKDTAVSRQNARDSPVSLQNAKNSAENLLNANDAMVHMKADVVRKEEENNTTMSIVNVEDTPEILQNSKDPLHSLECAKNIALSLENAKNAEVRIEEAEYTAGNLENAKDLKDPSPVSLESAKDTAVSLVNANNSAISQENAHDSALNRPQDSNLQAQKKVGESESTLDVYQCKCGLHFLDEKSITEHFSQCGSKSKQAKQNCSKCGLLFTPNVLFKHLLTHHGDKNNKLKIIIMENHVKKILL